MIKFIKRRFDFLIILLLFNNLYSMENKDGNSSLGSSQMLLSTWLKLHCSCGLELHHPPHEALPPLKCTAYDLLPQGSSAEKLQQLYRIADIFLLQDWLVNEVKELAFHNTELMNAIPEVPLCCISVDGVVQNLEEHESEKCEHILELNQSKYSLKLVSALKCLWFQEGIWKDAKALNDFYYDATRCINEEKEDYALIKLAQYIKHSISRYWLESRSKVFFDACLSRLFFGQKKEVSPEEQQTIADDPVKLKYHIAQGLIDSKIYKVILQLLPNFIDNVITVSQLKKQVDTLNKLNEIKLEQVFDLQQKIIVLVLKYEESYNKYKVLYKEIFDELKRNGNLNREIFLAPPLHKFPDILKVPIFKSLFRDYEAEIANQQSYLDDVSIPVTHPAKTPVKGKKRNRVRRKHKEPEVASAPQGSPEALPGTFPISPKLAACKEEETAQYFRYAKRINDWFNSEVTSDKRSVLYHTYPKLADIYIHKYGMHFLAPKKTEPSLIDKVYCLAGEIQYNDYRREEVIFCICFHKGECYHRGFSLSSDQKNMPEDIYLALLEKSEHCKSKSEESLKSAETKKVTVDKTTVCYKETPYCIKIYDDFNEAVITLFKITT